MMILLTCKLHVIVYILHHQCFLARLLMYFENSLIDLSGGVSMYGNLEEDHCLEGRISDHHEIICYCTHNNHIPCFNLHPVRY